MKGLLFVVLFSLEFTRIKASTNEQKQDQNAHQPNITEEGISSNSCLLGRPIEDTNLKWPLTVQHRAATELAGPLPAALTLCIWRVHSALFLAGLSTVLGPAIAPPGLPLCLYATLHHMWKVCLKHHIRTERITDWGTSPKRSSHWCQGEPRTTTLTALLFPLETCLLSRQAREIHGRENTLKPNAYRVHLLREQPGSWALILCNKFLQ